VWLALLGVTGCRYTEYPAPPLTEAPPLLPGQSNDVFTTAHSSVGEAVRHFLNRHAEPVQPFDFPHSTHVQQGIGCADYCHTGVATGPVAGIPGLSTCMACHSAIATDKPRIQQITAQSEKGIDMAWRRVFDFYPESHVRFAHAPHIRSNVECSTCHGDIAEQTVARRNVEMTMGYCVNCHRQNEAPVDCLTCHN
jgi:hypothetical protein